MSVSKDLSFYGILKPTRTTSKLKRLINRQRTNRFHGGTNLRLNCYAYFETPEKTWAVNQHGAQLTKVVENSDMDRFGLRHQKVAGRQRGTVNHGTLCLDEILEQLKLNIPEQRIGLLPQLTPDR